MSIVVLKAGLQTSLQANPRNDYRHFGVPWSGPADPLSMSLANRLVGNTPTATALEVTLGGLKLLFSEATAFAVTGATSHLHLNRVSVEPHTTHFAEAGDVLEIGGVTAGCRSYIAVAGEIVAQSFLGSQSTYIPGGFGGFDGRVLRDGDELKLNRGPQPERTQTPARLRPFFNDRFTIQVVAGPDFEKLKFPDMVLGVELTATARCSRMGVQLSGSSLEVSGAEQLKSSAVFPGTVQCPPDGKPFILLSDSQTTGGYPHILQVMKTDRFQLGQIKQGAEIRFILRSPEYALESYRQRWAAYSDWLSEPVI